MMTKNKQPDMANELLAGNFAKSGPHVAQLSDPLVDTPMVVTIDQLKPYDHNPRIVRNPLYEDIKLSIRERGLDSPPAITRRPQESHFIIRNGGNTRLSILQELWAETKDERFYKIHCLFRPWQNEVSALTGHLVENELHGQLTFIERALAIHKLNEFYQKEGSNFFSQRQLAKKIAEDGYPISQVQISHMQDTINYLLPVIPNLLYGGLSRTKVIQILKLRKSAKNVWETYNKSSEQTIVYTFDDLFSEVLSLFDDQVAEIDFNRFQDELTSRIAATFNCHYNLIALEFTEKDHQRRILELPPSPEMEFDEATLFSKSDTAPKPVVEMDEKEILAIPMPMVKKPAVTVTRTKSIETPSANHETIEPMVGLVNTAKLSVDVDDTSETQTLKVEQLINDHIVSPIETTPRLEAIQEMLAELTETDEQDFKSNVVKAIPVQAGGLYPISDIWHINPSIDNLTQLRSHIGQLVLEIFEEFNALDAIHTIDTDLGFACNPSSNTNNTVQALTLWFTALSSGTALNPLEDLDKSLIAHITLLTGRYQSISGVTPLSDAAFVKLMRAFRLIRRFCELQALPEHEME